MDPRDPRQRSFDRPSTLGQTWRKMNQPPGRKVGDLPPLPNWPPLPGEQFTGDWPPLGPELTEPAEPGGEDAYQQTGASEAAQPWPLEISKPETGVLHRWRHATTRMRLGIVAGLVLSVLLIVACSSLALHAASGLMGGGDSLPSMNPLATQQPAGVHATPGSSSTVTPGATSAATSAPTSTATATASQPLTLTFTCASGSLHGTGQVCVHTQPSAALDLTVRYCDGTLAKGLHGSALANSSGDYTWSWPVRSACVGAATATVTAKWNGQTMTATKSFAITA